MKTPRALVALALLAGACSITRYPPPAPPRQPTLGLSISTTTLPNGLRVVLVKDPHAIDVQVTMRYQAGAADDADHPGMAHFVEHLMFQQVLDKQPLFTHLEDSATHFNAYTSHDATIYVARARAERLDKLLAIEAARLGLRCKTITDAAFARERDVVINEIKERDQASEVYTAIHGVLYPNHPYRQAVGGSAQSVNAITREQACAFIDAHYTPGNAVMVIAGNIGDRARGALDTFATTVGARAAIARPALPAITSRPPSAERPVPIDDQILVLAWPLPVDPVLQAKVRAVAAALPRLVDSEIKGRVVALELGDRGAPMFGLAVLHADDETFDQAAAGAWRGVNRLPTVFRTADRLDDVMFDRVRQAAIFGVYSSLEDGSDRDLKLANYVVAGHDPSTALAAELDALRGLTRDEGAQLARQYFDANAPTVITLKPNEGKKRGQSLALRKPIHDMGQRRTPPDPTLAQRPAEQLAAGDVVGAKTHVLPNGLKVVLLPLTSVPTVDIRLIFRSGTADEAPTHRGLAMLTAHALTWDMHHLNDLMAFAAAGGMKTTDVDIDRTSFSVQGIDTHLDVLLAGLRRWVRDGTFDDDSAKLVIQMRRAAKRADDEGVLTDTWRAALFGAEHPYVRAGLVRHSNSALTLDDAAQFRARHYTPANATLVIAGRFDPALADRWIDFLFADWRGPSAPRPTTPAASQPASIAKIDDVAMLQLRIAMPANASNRAAQLVAAEMLSEIARDVRYQLGASYAVDAALYEQRLARHYVIGGWIDTARSAAALQLIRDRIQRLRNNADAAARAFVIARSHVVAQLLSRVGSAESLASRVEHDVALEREAMSDLKTAAAVQSLTIEHMSPAFAELDLSRAVVLMRGPAAELKTAFAALGRTPSYVQQDPLKDAAQVAPPGTAEPVGTTAAPVLVSQVENALTEQPPPRRMLTVVLNTASGRLSEALGSYSIGGASLSVHAGYRLSRNRAVGVRTAVGLFDGTFINTQGMEERLSVIPIDVGAFFHYGGGFTRAWVEASVGLHLDRAAVESTRWYAGAGYSLQLGYDFWRRRPHRIGIAVGFSSMSFTTSESGSGSWALGVYYGR